MTLKPAQEEMRRLAADPAALSRAFTSHVSPAWSEDRQAAFPVLLGVVLDLGGDGTLDAHFQEAAALVGKLTAAEAREIAASVAVHVPGAS